jgi:DNA-binding transcriptional LysR family regulator
MVMMDSLSVSGNEASVVSKTRLDKAAKKGTRVRYNRTIMVKLDGISSFVAIAEAGSISAAARRLHLSKSVVSERLAELEQTLGAPLFHRTTRKISLTEDGVAFLERANRIVWEVREATAEVSERRGTLIGPMRLSAPVTFGRMHLGPALYPFLAKHPGISLTLELDDKRVDAAAEGYDAVIRHGVVEDSRLVVLPLAPSKRMLVASPAYLERHGMPSSLDDLAGHRAIYYTNRNVADWRFPDETAGVFVRPPAALRVNNGDMMRDAALAGLGLALLPSFIVGADVKSGRLARVDVGREAAEELIYVAHPEGRRASKKLQELVSSLRKAFGSPPYWDG